MNTHRSDSPPSRWSTYQAFACVIMLSAVLLAIVFLICWRSFDRGASGSFGLRDSLASFMAGAYGPILGASFVGYRDAAASLFLRKKEDASPTYLPAPVFFYLLAISGIVGALVTVIYVSTGVDDSVAKYLTGASATYWGTTVGWTFDKLFKKLTVQP